MTTGQTILNGTHGLHANGVNWHEPITIVRRDPQSYGCTRYLVVDRHGRHTYAY